MTRSIPRGLSVCLPFLAATLLGATATAGQTPPVDTITRDGGGVTVRATRVQQPIQLDGRLDEQIYTTVKPASGFIQIEPQPGAQATDQTEVWVFFDNDNIYVGARAFDSDMSIVGTEMRRDNNATWNGNDLIGVAFDTFYDRRSSFAFIVNALGGRQDGQVANESQWNGDWNPVYNAAVGRFERGWTAEFAIPFKSLRYGPGAVQTWGINFVRPSRTINEISFLTEVPPARGQGGFNMASRFATLTGLEAPPSSRTLEFKPFVTSSASQDRRANADDLTGDIGLDAKIGIVQGITADITLNTDFAQVEADEQQVNLTRFSLFFPEKREFFLENAGTFSFGGVPVNGQNAGNGAAPILFYSRRIGLESGAVIPLQAGGRVSGRVGPYSLGILSIRADENDAGTLPATTFSVVRVKRDILRRSAIGVLATARSTDRFGSGANYAYGADATFGFFNSLSINTFWAKTQSERLSGDDTSYRAQVNLNEDRYGFDVDRLKIGRDFNPEVGLVRRPDMQRTFGEFRFSPRPRAGRFSAIRKFSYSASANFIENGDGVLETRERSAAFGVDFFNSDTLDVTFVNSYEFLTSPFDIARDVTLPIGGYHFNDIQASYSIAQQRPIRAVLAVSRGTFYSGHKTTFRATGGRVRVSNQISLEPAYTLNNVDLAEGHFTSHLVSTRATYTVTPLMFVSALVQYNTESRSVSTNARLRWEYQPGSELFVVYNEQRDTFGVRFPELANRAFIVKVNRLFRF
jgi:hypothetical protein